ncbi:MAG: hypothetical protein U1F87_05925 [Kiritimatiellia bacterium]
MMEAARPAAACPTLRRAGIVAGAALGALAGFALLSRLLAALGAHPLLPPHRDLTRLVPDLLAATLAADLVYRCVRARAGGRRETRWFRALTFAHRGGLLLAVLLPFLLNLSLLLGQWRGCDHTGGFSLGGHLPISDAAGYYSGAMRLVETGELNEYAARRPLGSTLTASLYWLSGRDLPALLAMQVLLVSASMSLAAGFMGRLAGLFPAMLLAALLSYSYDYTNGAVMTETAGAVLGNLAFAGFGLLILTGRSAWLFTALTTLGLALFARTGAMFVLPAVVAWAALDARRDGWRRIAARLGLALAALVAAVVVNKLSFLALRPEGDGARQMGDFSHYLYNFTLPGEHPWDYAQQAVPGLSAPGLTDREVTGIIFNAAIDNIRSNPLGVARTALQKYASGLPNLFRHLVLFQQPLPPRFLLLCFLGGLAAPFCFVPPPARRLAALLVAALLGSYLSLLNCSRLPRATAPWRCALLATGAAVLLAAAGRLLPGRDRANRRHAPRRALRPATLLFLVLTRSPRPRAAGRVFAPAPVRRTGGCLAARTRSRRARPGRRGDPPRDRQRRRWPAPAGFTRRWSPVSRPPELRDHATRLLDGLLPRRVIPPMKKSPCSRPRFPAAFPGSASGWNPPFKPLFTGRPGPRSREHRA